MLKNKINLIILSLFTSFNIVLAQEKTITGTVKDKSSGKPLPGVNIRIKNSNTGTVTDEDGRFKLKEVKSGNILILSFTGYKTKRLKVGDKNKFNIKLSEKIGELNEVVVTAGRSKEKLKNVSQKVQVISEQEIENTDHNSITDVLKKNAAVDVIQYPGMLSGVGIRGFRPEFSGYNQKTLTLINGRPAAANNISLINTSNIERIEVMKGPGSALYGSNAMGGTINIITKKSQGPVTGKVFGSGGSFDTWSGGFSVGGNVNEKLDFDASYNHFFRGQDYRLGEDNIFRDFMGSDKTKQFYRDMDSTIKISDDTGDGQKYDFTNFSRYSTSLRLGYDIKPGWRIDIRGDLVKAKNVKSPKSLHPSLFSEKNKKDLSRYSSDITLHGQLNQNNELMARGYYGQQKTTRYKVSQADTFNTTTTYNNQIKTYSWQGFQLKNISDHGKYKITSGIDYNLVKSHEKRFNKKGERISPFDPDNGISSWGAYTQAKGSFLNDKLIPTIGLRYELTTYNISPSNLSDYKKDTSASNRKNDFLSPTIGIVYKIDNNLSLRTHLGRGFTVPSVFHIAGYEVSNDGKNKVNITEGNPDLNNQVSNSGDIGLNYHNANKGITGGLTYYHTIFDNKSIQTINSPDQQKLTKNGDTIQSITSYKNAESSLINGLEGNFSIDFGTLFDQNYSIKTYVNGNYIFNSNNIEKVMGQEREINMYNVADFNVNYGIGYSNNNWLSMSLKGRYVGNRLDRNWNIFTKYVEVRYSDFLIHDLITTFTIKDQHDLSLMVNNITDENYYEKRGFNLPGRNFKIRYTYKIQ